MNYLNLALEVEHEGIKVHEYKFKNLKLKGLYTDGVITLNSSYRASEAEKTCILAEEIGHYHTSYGNILNQKDKRNVKQEKRARNWAYEKLVPLDMLIEAYLSGIRNRNELAAFLEVTEDFIGHAIKHYYEKYGLYVNYKDYLIYFEPLGIFRRFE